MGEPGDRDIGEMAVERGLISRTQLDEALAEVTARLERSENPTSDTLTLISVLIAHGYLRPADVSDLLRSRSPHDEPVPNDVAQARGFPDSRFGKYTIVKLIGTGGMGSVYKAWDDELRRDVALKFLTVGTADNIRRFIREAQTAARLNHPGIAQVYDAGTLQGRHFIAMEFVDGLTLDLLPESVRRGEIDKIVRIVRDVALAVDYAHSKGIIHRDLKPQNVMIDDLLKPRVMDFGLARAVATEELRDPSARPITIGGTIVGTPNFIAPEQARGETESVDPRTDVYALGATLYALVAGRPPFSGVTPLDILMAVIQHEPARPSQFNDAIARDLESVVLRCLEKEPAARYQSAREVADELGRVLAREPVRTRGGGLVAWMRRTMRRRPGALVAGAAIVALAVAALVVVERERRRANEDRLNAIERDSRETIAEQQRRRRAAAQKHVDEGRVHADRAERMLLVGPFERPAFDAECDAALKALARALEADSMFAVAHVVRCEVLAMAGRLREAEVEATNALELDPDSRAALARRASVRLRLAARGDTRKLRDAAADYARAGGGIAEGVGLLAARDASAADGLGRAAKAEPAEHDIHLAHGVALLAASRPADAGEAFARAGKCLPNGVDWRLALATARLQQGRAPDALEQTRAAVALGPRDADAHELDGNARRASGDAKGAAEAWERALGIDPSREHLRAKISDARR